MIKVKLWRKSNFNVEFSKALDWAKMSLGASNWFQCLTSSSPRRNLMSLTESVDLLKRWHIYNKLPITSTERITSVTSALDNALSKKKPKVNTIIFHGETNAGKSIVIKSAFRAFPHVFQLYHGVPNNFMFADAVGAQAILWEEKRFNSQQQEAYKLLMERAEMSIAVKGTKNDTLNRTPVEITCNQLPWCSMTHTEDENAFKNRSYIYNMASTPWLKAYEKKGDIDPRA